ncbi:MAG: GGDEF domain-containing protein [Terracidiphilus sp.]
MSMKASACFRRWRTAQWASISFLFLCALPGWAGSQVPLTSLSEIHKLSNAEASKSVPVAFEATVTYFRAYEKTMFVQDGDTAIFVLATTSHKFQPGDRLLIRGITKGSFRPIVVSSDLTLVRHEALPQPASATFVPLVQAKFDCRYVTVRGRIRLAADGLSSGRHVTQFELMMKGGETGVTVDEGVLPRLSDLLDAEAEVTGVVSGQFDGKMQETGVLLHASSLDDIKILHKAAVDPWSIPITPMNEVLTVSDDEDHTQRVRVEGVITYFYPTQMAVLQEGSQSIRILTPTIERLQVGDRAEAIGIPAVDHGFLTLKSGDLRSIETAAPVNPLSMTWDEVASGKHAFDLVSIEGSVVTQVREHSQDVYIISSEGHLFSAAVRHPYTYEYGANVPLPPMPAIPAGAMVRVKGVVIHDDANPFNGPMAFGILLRSASDIEVVASPSLLNVRNLVSLVSVLLLVVIAVCGWVWMLRRKVHEQTAELATRAEAEALLERRRSAILEDINGTRPLGEILQQITDLISFRLGGAPCWCEIGDGIVVGNCPAEIGGLNVIRQEISSRTGPLHGILNASIDPHAPLGAHAPEALSMGAWLATMGIETRGLYSDLVHRSEFDLLTDIYNRFSFERRLSSALEDAERRDALFGLIYIDLDEFKQVNDQYGHRAGDHYLQEAAARMKRQLRPMDMLARLGGDEFAVLVANIRGRSDVEDVAARLERCFREPFLLEGYTLEGSASVGVALFPEDGTSKDSLLSAADAAMYVAKNVRKEAGQQNIA